MATNSARLNLDQADTGAVRPAELRQGQRGWRMRRWRIGGASGGASRRGLEKESRVRDLVFILVTIGFFLVAIGYLRGCERLK